MTELATRTPISWTPPDDMSFDAWQESLNGLWVAQAALPWLLGDCLNAGQAAFGEDYPQALPESSRAKESLRVYKWVAEKIPAVTRVTELSWSHHRAVAKLEPPEQARWLERAQTEGMSLKALKQALKPVVTGPAAEDEPDQPTTEPQVEILPPKARGTTEYHDADEDQLESLKRAWNRAGQDAREQFLAWKDDNERPVFDSGQADLPPMPKFLRRGVRA